MASTFATNRSDRTLAAGSHPAHREGANDAINEIEAAVRGVAADVRHYGALGDGLTDDTAAIQAAIAAAPAVYVPAGTYKVTARLAIPSSRTLFGEGRASVLDLYGSTSLSLLATAGASGPAASLAADAMEGALSVTLVAGGAASLGLVAGDYVFLTDANATAQMNRVTSVAGDAVSLADPLYESLTTASAATLAKVTPIVDVTIRNLTLLGSHNTGATSHGIHLLRAARCAVEDVDCRQFTGAGLYLDTGDRNGGRRIRLSACGSASVSDLECRRNTGFHFADVDSCHATGFGPQFAFSNGGLVRNLRSVGASGRAVKLQRCAHTEFANVRAHGSAPTYTGFSVTQGSHRNRAVGLSAVGNGAAGIWFEGAGDTDNVLLGVHSSDNRTRNLELGTGADGNLIEGEVDTTGLSDAAAGTVLRPAPGGADAARQVAWTSRPRQGSAQPAAAGLGGLLPPPDVRHRRRSGQSAWEAD